MTLCARIRTPKLKNKIMINGAFFQRPAPGLSLVFALTKHPLRGYKRHACFHTAPRPGKPPTANQSPARQRHRKHITATDRESITSAPAPPQAHHRHRPRINHQRDRATACTTPLPTANQSPARPRHRMHNTAADRESNTSATAPPHAQHRCRPRIKHQRDRAAACFPLAPISNGIPARTRP